jgi:hypothetical protein
MCTSPSPSSEVGEFTVETLIMQVWTHGIHIYTPLKEAIIWARKNWMLSRSQVLIKFN